MGPQISRRFAVVVVTAVLVGVVPAPALAQDVPPTPPRDEWYAFNDKGHFTGGKARVRVDKSCLGLPKSQQGACSLKAFQKRPFVVIAFVDTGINPYHHDFRAPEFRHHPSKYIAGYPDDAGQLDLSLDVADSKWYAAARAADDKTWLTVAPNKLYWIPGTRIIGAISRGAGDTVAPWEERRILDDQGHGTGVASVGAGEVFGSNPNALIVAVEGLGNASLEWAVDQPWIDIVSNSWGNAYGLPLGDPGFTKEAVDRGQSIMFSSGNGLTNTNSSSVFPVGNTVPDPCKCKTPDSNPSLTDPWGAASWFVTVGAVSPINGQAHWWHSIPADVSSFGSKWRAAGAFGVEHSPEETRDFGGTSCAAPTTGGVLSSIIERARVELGDTTEGQRPKGVVAQGRGASTFKEGPLEDGQLTREEAEAILQKTAFPVPADPQKVTWDYAVRPTTPLYYVYQGYGLVDRTSQALAFDVLLGKEPLPDRAEVDAWIGVMDQARDALWPPG